MTREARRSFLKKRTKKLLAVLAVLTATKVHAAEELHGFLEHIHRHSTLTSTVPDNGDLNPYAVVVAPVSAGKVQKDDVLVDNFNNIANLQGTGTTIVGYRPSTRATYLFAKVPQKLPQCPGGVGLTTAMTMLKSGWIIVGSTPSKDGTTGTKGPGCMLVLDSNGKLAAVWSGPTINDPWGDMAVIDRGNAATLFISMAGFDIPSPNVIDPKTGIPVVIRKSTVLRLQVTIADGKPPVLIDQTVIGEGFAARADRRQLPPGPDRRGTLARWDPLCHRRTRQRDRRHFKRPNTIRQRRHGPRCHQRWPTLLAARHDLVARRPPAGLQWQGRAAGGG